MCSHFKAVHRIIGHNLGVTLQCDEQYFYRIVTEVNTVGTL